MNANSWDGERATSDCPCRLNRDADGLARFEVGRQALGSGAPFNGGFDARDRVTTVQAHVDGIINTIPGDTLRDDYKAFLTEQHANTVELARLPRELDTLRSQLLTTSISTAPDSATTEKARHAFGDTGADVDGSGWLTMQLLACLAWHFTRKPPKNKPYTETGLDMEIISTYHSHFSIHACHCCVGYPGMFWRCLTGDVR